MKGGYVDGFVLPVPKKNLAMYKKMAAPMAKLTKKYGALDYKECMIEDANPNKMPGVYLSFAKMVKPKKGETIWFSFIVYKSKKHRDQVFKKMMADPAMNNQKWKDMPMPFDMKRMAMAGFKVEVSS